MIGKKKPWCIRTESRSDRLVVCKQVKILYLSLILKKSAAGLTLIYGALTLSIAVYDEVTSWGDFWETLNSGIGFVYFSLVIWLVGECIYALCHRRAKRMLLPARCQICPKCLYDLSARARDIDTCPECGVIAPRCECIRLWCKLLRTKL